ILAGAKLTGKGGGYYIGLLGARTRENDFPEAKDFFVAPVKRNIFKQSLVGGIFTNGDTKKPKFSRTFWGDVRNFKFHFLGKDQNFGVDGFLLKTSNEGVKGKDSSFGFGVRYPNDLWGLSIDWKQIGENFRPALGFVPRTDVRKLSLSAEFDPRPKD